MLDFAYTYSALPRNLLSVSYKTCFPKHCLGQISTFNNAQMAKQKISISNTPNSNHENFYEIISLK